MSFSQELCCLVSSCEIAYFYQAVMRSGFPSKERLKLIYKAEEGTYEGKGRPGIIFYVIQT